MSIQLFLTLFRYIASGICFLLEYNINLVLMRKKYSYDHQSQILKCKLMIDTI